MPEGRRPSGVPPKNGSIQMVALGVRYTKLGPPRAHRTGVVPGRSASSSARNAGGQGGREVIVLLLRSNWVVSRMRHARVGASRQVGYGESGAQASIHRHD